MTAWLAAGGIALGLLVGSLAEYFVHIGMHRRVLLSRTHFNHHREPEGENWFKQFAYYVAGSFPLSAAVCLVTWPLGVFPLGLEWHAAACFGRPGWRTPTHSNTSGPNWRFG